MPNLRFYRVVLLGALSAACASPGLEPDPAGQDRVDELLRYYSNRTELSRFVGTLPNLCLPSSHSTELCQWMVDPQSPAWQPLAHSIDTGDRVNLICELSTFDEPRAEGWCSVYPRRSNRFGWGFAGTRKTKTVVLSDGSSEVRTYDRRTAEIWVEGAEDLSALSFLLGALPDTCSPESENGEWICTWRTSEHTFGHGTLAMWIGARKTSKVRLRCRLPSDGSPRAPRSCFAEVGD